MLWEVKVEEKNAIDRIGAERWAGPLLARNFPEILSFIRNNHQRTKSAHKYYRSSHRYMLNWPYKDHPNNSSSLNHFTTSPTLITKHGLLSLPTENLTHITSYLDPPALFALQRVNRVLCDHVKEEHTWYRAFVSKFLGISPEGDVDSEKAVLLRRTENSWKKEYVVRFNLLRWIFLLSEITCKLTFSPQDVGSVQTMQRLPMRLFILQFRPCFLCNTTTPSWALLYNMG